MRTLFFIFSLTPNFRRISRALGLESENIKSKVRRFTREPRSYMSSQLPGQIQKCPNDFYIFPNDIQIFQVNFRRFQMRFRNLHVNFRFNKVVLMMNCSPPKGHQCYQFEHACPHFSLILGPKE